MRPMLNIAISAARSASKIMLRYYDRLDSVEITEKNRNDLVTQVDQLCEEEIIAHIRKAHPNHAIIAEESGEQPGDEEYTWIIDPLDGTMNFVHGFPQFAISIALKHKDKLELGLVYDPLRQELFTAIRGSGSRLNDRRIRVSDQKKLDQSLIGTGFPFRNSSHFAPYMTIFTTLFPQTAGIRRAGAAALDLAYVAAGRLDGFWEASLRPWDMAAGALLIQEAGGIVTDFSNQENYLESGNIVAGNLKIHQALTATIQETLEI